MILKSIQNDQDSRVHRELCQRFSSSIELEHLQQDFNKIQGDRVQVCSQLEQFIINDDEKFITATLPGEDNERSAAMRSELLSFGQKLKTHGMELSRGNAQEFNDFIKAALGEWANKCQKAHSIKVTK